MDALILGGQSPRHYDWVRQLAEVLQPRMAKVVFLDYHHWQAENQNPDIDYEIAQAAKLSGQLGDYIVVAKSIGTVIAALAVARGSLSPKRCVLMGLPLGLINRLPEVGKAFKSLPPTIFLQNSQDPLGSAAAVDDYIKAHQPSSYELKTLPAETHDYLDFDLIVKLAAD